MRFPAAAAGLGLAASACFSEPQPPSDACTSTGDVVDDGYEIMHYARTYDDAGLTVFERRWVHGASTEARTEFLYTRGLLVHRLDDVDGDERVEVVTDWTYDDAGRLLRTEQYDRVSRRLVTVDQVYEGEAVVRRTERIDGSLVREQVMSLDDAGRVEREDTYGADGTLDAWWRATYDRPGPSLDRHRVGYLDQTLFVDADERFDDDGRLVGQQGLVDGFFQTYTARWGDDGLLFEESAFGELVATHTRSYDAGGRLVEEVETLVGAGEPIDHVVSSWSYSCAVEGR
mgnify:CR=1 FL=1